MKLTKLMNQMDLTDIYRLFHRNTQKHTFFSAPYRSFSKIDHILNHKVSLSRYKKIEITPCIFFKFFKTFLFLFIHFTLLS
jgi:exonuclease III